MFKDISVVISVQKLKSGFSMSTKFLGIKSVLKKK